MNRLFVVEHRQRMFQDRGQLLQFAAELYGASRAQSLGGTPSQTRKAATTNQNEFGSSKSKPTRRLNSSPGRNWSVGVPRHLVSSFIPELVESWNRTPANAVAGYESSYEALRRWHPWSRRAVSGLAGPEWRVEYQFDEAVPLPCIGAAAVRTVAGAECIERVRSGVTRGAVVHRRRGRRWRCARRRPRPCNRSCAQAAERTG